MKKILILVALSLFSSTAFAQSNPIFDRLLANAPKTSVEKQKELFDDSLEEIIIAAPQCADELTKNQNTKKKLKYTFLSSCSVYVSANKLMNDLDSVEDFKENSARYKDMLVAEQSLTAIGFVSEDYNNAVEAEMERNAKLRDMPTITTIGPYTCISSKYSTRCF